MRRLWVFWFVCDGVLLRTVLCVDVLWSRPEDVRSWSDLYTHSMLVSEPSYITNGSMEVILYQADKGTARGGSPGGVCRVGGNGGEKEDAVQASCLRRRPGVETPAVPRGLFWWLGNTRMLQALGVAAGVRGLTQSAVMRTTWLHLCRPTVLCYSRFSGSRVAVLPPPDVLAVDGTPQRGPTAGLVLSTCRLAIAAGMAAAQPGPMCICLMAPFTALVQACRSPNPSFVICLRRAPP